MRVTGDMQEGRPARGERALGSQAPARPVARPGLPGKSLSRRLGTRLSAWNPKPKGRLVSHKRKGHTSTCPSPLSSFCKCSYSFRRPGNGSPLTADASRALYEALGRKRWTSQQEWVPVKLKKENVFVNKSTRIIFIL